MNEQNAYYFLICCTMHRIIDVARNNAGDQCFIRDAYEAVYVRLTGFYEQYPDGDYQRFLEVLK